MINKKSLQAGAEIRNLNKKSLIQNMRGEGSFPIPEIPILKVKIINKNTESGIPLYDVCLLGLNDMISDIIFNGIRGVDDSVELSIGTICLMVSVQGGRKYILNSSGSNGGGGGYSFHIHDHNLIGEGL